LPQSHYSIASIGCPQAGAKLSFEELEIPDLDLIKQAQQGAGRLGISPAGRKVAATMSTVRLVRCSLTRARR
jgi:hypothetical protein